LEKKGKEGSQDLEKKGKARGEKRKRIRKKKMTREESHKHCGPRNEKETKREQGMGKKTPA